MYIDFITESNAIEGIRREPTHAEIREMHRFMELEEVTIDDLVQFVSVYQPNARLRDSLDEPNVRIGNHRPPMSSPAIRPKLQLVLEEMENAPISANMTHYEYEILHPFTDCNGRSGRALWLWHCKQTQDDNVFEATLKRGFLHSWYYQSLAAPR